MFRFEDKAQAALRSAAAAKAHAISVEATTTAQAILIATAAAPTAVVTGGLETVGLTARLAAMVLATIRILKSVGLTVQQSVVGILATIWFLESAGLTAKQVTTGGPAN